MVTRSGMGLAMAVLFVVVFGAAAISASGSLAPVQNPAPAQSEAAHKANALPQAKPDPGPGHNDSVTDGCQRNPGGLLLDYSPEWAPVYNKAIPQNQPMPPTQVTGTVMAGAPDRTATHPSGGDLPAAHFSHDFNVNILPDPQYDYLVAGHNDPDPLKQTGNYAGVDDGTGRLHTEYEGLTLPPYAWADVGDRITEVGNWVWDCGHWGTPTQVNNVVNYDLHLLPDQECIPNPLMNPDPQCTPTGEQTEFHPYRVVWIQRAAQSRAAEGESTADFFVSTDSTRSGVIAACTHSTPPPTPPPPVSPYTLCLQTHSLWQDVSGDYTFFLPAPPRPSPTAVLTYRAVQRDSVGAPAPTLTPTGNGVQVTVHLQTAQDQRLVMGYSIFAGWSEVPLSAVPTHLQVHFDLPEDNLTVHRAMDPNCLISNGVPVFTPQCVSESTRYFQSPPIPPTNPTRGTWTMYYDVGSQWDVLKYGNQNCPPPLGAAAYDGEFCPAEGDVSHSHQVVDLYVPPGQGWRMQVISRECDTGGLPGGPWSDCPSDRSLGDNEDVPGEVLDSFASAAASLGVHHSNGRTACTSKAGAPCGTPQDTHDHDSTCPSQMPDGSPANPDGCYTLTYTVTEVNDIGSRVIGPVGAPGQLPNTPIRPPSQSAMAALLALGTCAVLVLLLAGGRRSRH